MPPPAAKTASGQAVIKALLQTQRVPIRGPAIMGDLSSQYSRYYWYASSAADAVYYADLNGQRASTVAIRYSANTTGMTISSASVTDTGTQWYPSAATLTIGATQALPLDTTLRSFGSSTASVPWHADLQLQSSPTDGNFKVCWFLSVPNASRSLCVEADRDGNAKNFFTVEIVNGRVVLIQEN